LSTVVYLNYTQDELDRAYDQRVWADNATDLIAQYASASAAVRGADAHLADIRYGPAVDETLDWFPATGNRRPIHVHLHGGAWRALDKSDVSFAAPAFTASGVHFVAPGFTNLPALRLPDMIGQLVRALTFLYLNGDRFGGDPDRIFISGHSSGAHLCAVLLGVDWTAYGVPADLIKGGVCIAGIYDLEPVLLSSRRNYVHLTPQEMLRLSPARDPERIRCPLTIAHGGKESPEFVRQATSFADALARSGNPPRRIVMPALNHFEIAMELGRPGSPINDAALAQIAAAECR
jgi:arylformamidase